MKYELKKIVEHTCIKKTNNFERNRYPPPPPPAPWWAGITD